MKLEVRRPESLRPTGKKPRCPEWARDARRLTCLTPSSMAKRNATGSRTSRKRRKGGASYAAIDLDAPDGGSQQIENIHVWNISMSETNRRLSATRRNHKHLSETPLEHLREEPPTVEHADLPADPEPHPAKLIERRKRVRILKENDSVSPIFARQVKLTMT